ncbi:MAG: threonine/serine exporter family protein [Clostridiales bacterium]|nr:threonine/serine exporter family protein [Clostridiales bacterium]
MRDIIFHFVVAYLATAAFGIVFYAPVKTLPFSAVTGAFGYISYYLILQHIENSEILACTAGGIVIAFLSEIFAAVQKNPVTAYEMPAIMPLVPGIGLYRTMITFMQNDSVGAIDYLFQTILSAASIAIGLILTETVTQAWLRHREKKRYY